MDTGRILAVILTNSRTNVIYERFYAKFSDLERAGIREAFQQAGEGVVLGAGEEAETCSRYRWGLVGGAADTRSGSVPWPCLRL